MRCNFQEILRRLFYSCCHISVAILLLRTLQKKLLSSSFHLDRKERQLKPIKVLDNPKTKILSRGIYDVHRSNQCVSRKRVIISRSFRNRIKDLSTLHRKVPCTFPAISFSLRKNENHSLIHNQFM